MSNAKYEIVASNNQNILLEVADSGEVFIDGLSLTNPNFTTIQTSSGSFKVSTDGNIDTSGNVNIKGSLKVEGSDTRVLTKNTVIEDSIIELGHGTTGNNPTNDGGIAVNRGDLGASSIYWDESDKGFIMGTINSFDPLATTLAAQPYFRLKNNFLGLGELNNDVNISTNGTGNIKLSTNNDTTSGTIEIESGTNKNINLTPDGSGQIGLNSDQINLGL